MHIQIIPINDHVVHCSFLFQVDAALTSDPGNEELLKLKTDLQEVIDLTKELLSQSSTSGPSGDYGKVHDAENT
jgi:hypothetical protein